LPMEGIAVFFKHNEDSETPEPKVAELKEQLGGSAVEFADLDGLKKHLREQLAAWVKLIAGGKQSATA
jgi:hypothetical protein